MKYIKKFENHSAYEAAESSLILPNVSLCVQEHDVHYKPIVPPETRVVAKFNVTSTSSPTQIGYRTSGFSAIEIDDTELQEVVSAYTFSTTGEHTIKYTLADPTTIGGVAFYLCSGLTSVVIPDSVTIIGNSAFMNCSSLTSVTIGSGVTSIGDNVFQVCSGLTSIDIPDSVTSIGNYAFTQCSGMTSCTIGGGVTSIGNGAFRYCSALPSITIQATTPPTLGGNNVFIYTNDCPIYVPSESVETYKAALFWGDMSSRIQAME